MLDAPVSGGEPKAIDGTLPSCRWEEGVFERCYPVMKAMAASVVRVGDTGAGNVAKLANQIVVALNIAAMSEALVFRRQGRGTAGPGLPCHPWGTGGKHGA